MAPLSSQIHELSNHLSILPRPISLHVGSLIPRKNCQFLIDSFANYRFPGTLIILGNGSQLQDLIKKNIPNILFLGNVCNVQDYLHLSDIFVSTSRSEGLPNSVLEAGVSGLPMVLSNISPHAEISELVQHSSVHLYNNGSDFKELFYGF